MFSDIEREWSDATALQDAKVITQVSSDDSEFIHWRQDQNWARNQAQVGDWIDQGNGS